MEKRMETTIMGCIGFRFRVWNLEGMEKKMQTIIMGYIGTTVRIHSFIPSWPKVRLVACERLRLGKNHGNYWRLRVEDLGFRVEDEGLEKSKSTIWLCDIGVGFSALGAGV